MAIYVVNSLIYLYLFVLLCVSIYLHPMCKTVHNWALIQLSICWLVQFCMTEYFIYYDLGIFNFFSEDHKIFEGNIFIEVSIEIHFVLCLNAECMFIIIIETHHLHIENKIYVQFIDVLLLNLFSHTMV